jgi:hypothetical protein
MAGVRAFAAAVPLRNSWKVRVEESLLMTWIVLTNAEVEAGTV